MLFKRKYSTAQIDHLLKTMVVLVDTKEKSNEHIVTYFDKHKIPYKKLSLPSGDYSFMLPKNEDYDILSDLYFYEDIFIERKNSATELSGNFSTGRNRFESEFLRSKALKKYLMIENCSYKDIANGNYKTEYDPKSFLGSLHSFNQKYNLEIVFMPDQTLSPLFIYGTLKYYLRNILK